MNASPGYLRRSEAMFFLLWQGCTNSSHDHYTRRLIFSTICFPQLHHWFFRWLTQGGPIHNWWFCETFAVILNIILQMTVELGSPRSLFSRRQGGLLRIRFYNKKFSSHILCRLFFQHKRTLRPLDTTVLKLHSKWFHQESVSTCVNRNINYLHFPSMMQLNKKIFSFV